MKNILKISLLSVAATFFYGLDGVRPNKPATSEYVYRCPLPDMSAYATEEQANKVCPGHVRRFERVKQV